MFQVDNVKTSAFVSYLVKGYHMGWLKMNAIIFTRVKPDAFGDSNYSVIDHEELPQAQRIAKYL